MRILFAVQGTGNGHISRAKDIYPQLQKYGEVDLLLSGYQVDVDFPSPIKYRYNGISFIFGNHGGINMPATVKRFNIFQFRKDIRVIPIEQYDVIINDFEPVTAWACKMRKVPCFALSHQSAVLHPMAPKPQQNDVTGKWVLKHYAPFNDHCGFHFKQYDDKIFPPVIRHEVQQLAATNNGHYTVYLPAYDDITLVHFFKNFKKTEWQIFSKHNKSPFTDGNIMVRPIENEAFLQSLASCEGTIMGAGFEGPAEALYLNKKLLVIPMKGQYEQKCNAAAIATLGVPVINEINSSGVAIVGQWLHNDEKATVAFPENTAAIAVEKIMQIAQNYQR